MTRKTLIALSLAVLGLTACADNSIGPIDTKAQYTAAQRAEAGDVDSMWYLAELGDWLSVEDRLSWAEKAEAAGSADGALLLAMAFDSGKIGSQQNAVPIDHDQAERHYRLAAERFRARAAAGDAGAELMLGHLYDEGHGVPRDYAEAELLWLKAALVKPSAHDLVAALYLTGKRPAPYPTAVQEHLQAATEAGIWKDAVELGNLYLYGRIPSPDPTGDALAWYLRGVPYGCAECAVRAAAILAARQQWDEATSLWRQAAERGHPEAMRRLGLTLLDGIIPSPRPAVAALGWFTLMDIAGYGGKETAMVPPLPPADRAEAERWAREFFDAHLSPGASLVRIDAEGADRFINGGPYTPLCCSSSAEGR